MALESGLKIYKTPPVCKDKLDAFYKSSDSYLIELKKHDHEYLKNYVTFVNKYLGDNQKILDLGCGNGRSTHLLSALNKKNAAVGCDISHKFLSSFNHSGPDAPKYCAGDCSQLPFRDESMDIVSCFQLIEHLSEPHKALLEMIRVTRRGGLIIIISPNLFSPFPEFSDELFS